ncbi:hypothetical protein ASZ90_016094 [hydrocarbon metagenome]|uniref:Uncharacterized protein n=1 Tax=hydrocarbon metagenome TaxID=938273 RepID=A0A0W8F078_9ZZZZ
MGDLPGLQTDTTFREAASTTPLHYGGEEKDPPGGVQGLPPAKRLIHPGAYPHAIIL